jgi:hypothetical protein
MYSFASGGSRVSYETDVIDLDIPTLIGHSLLFSSGADIFVSRLKLVSSQWRFSLVHKSGHLYIEYNAPGQSKAELEALFSKSELVGIHRKLGHDSAETTERFLELAKPDLEQSSDRESLKEVLDECVVCEKFLTPSA